MQGLTADEDLFIDYLTMVFGEFRGRMFDVGGTRKRLDEYLLCPRRKHYYSKAYKTLTLRVSTLFDNNQDTGVHLYFHATELPFHFALHLGSKQEEPEPQEGREQPENGPEGREQQQGREQAAAVAASLETDEGWVYPKRKSKPNAEQAKQANAKQPNAKQPNAKQPNAKQPNAKQANASSEEEEWQKESDVGAGARATGRNTFHFTFDNCSLKNWFQFETGHPWCLEDVLEWHGDQRGLCYKPGTLATITDVYLGYYHDSEIEPSSFAKMAKSLRDFTAEFLEIMRGLATIIGNSPQLSHSPPAAHPTRVAHPPQVRSAMLEGASLIPPYTRALEFLYSMRSVGADHFVKINNEGIKQPPQQ
jgi:hypothetical protein